MLQNARRPSGRSAFCSLTPVRNIDVSETAKAAMFFGEVEMEPEAFGVTVTRREIASEADLTPEERARLLDVLCHAKPHQAASNSPAGKSFPIWVVSSDSRDGKNRTQWLTMRHSPHMPFYIGLSVV